MENRSIAGLDLIRFAAAAMVAFFHLGYFEWYLTGAAPFPELAPFASFGWVGVEVFFVLSGFVIAYSTAGKSAIGFARSRFLRLYPAVWICATITLAVSVTGANAYLRSMTLWPFAPFVDGVYWTLGVEMAFYGLVFVSLLTWGQERLSALIGAIGALSSLFWLLWLADHIMGGTSFQWTMGNRYFELLLIHYGCFFALGGAIWLIGFSQPGRGHWPVAVVSFGASLICIYSIAEIKSSGGEGHGPIAPLAVWMLAIVGMIGSVRYAEKLGGLSGKLSRTLGLATYPLYLLHHAVGVPIMVGLITWNVPAPAALAIALVAAGILSVAVLKLESHVRASTARAWDFVAGLGAQRLEPT